MAPADRSYNCHGWVFTGGLYFLPDDEVEPILQENGYQVVDHPQAGDLIIYHNDRGQVAHSGRVWAVGDGNLLVESKWAWLGRYLHPPEASPFGHYWTFFHSARPDHRLRGLDAPGTGAGQRTSSRD